MAQRSAIALPLPLDADRPLVRPRRGAKLAVIVDIEPRGVAEAERGRGAGIGAVLAFADALHGDALGAEAKCGRTEILHDVVHELAIGGQIQDLAVENPVVPDLGAE